MPTPFPGMDPYLEQPGLWVQVHAGLILEIQKFLAPLLRPRYHVAIEQRSYLSLWPPDEQLIGIPDALVLAPSETDEDIAAVVEPSVTVQTLEGELPMPETVYERYLEVRDAATSEVITVIEILSPTNKTTRDGRAQYERKRLKILGSLTNLVEIDLTRIGQPFAMKVKAKKSDYRIVVSRAKQRPKADIYLFGIRHKIPDFPIPLREGEKEPILPLNKILHELYEAVGYDLVINYQQAPKPPLPKKEAEWVAQLLTKQILANFARTEGSR
jgi:hypothetical protein